MKMMSRKLLLHSFVLALLCAWSFNGTTAQENVEEALSRAVDARDEVLVPEPEDEVALKVWSAEVLGSEGQFEKAASEYLGAALLSDDPEIAQRATEVAINAKSWELAAMAADRWVLLDPDNLQARETATRTLLIGGDMVRAEIQLKEFLQLLADSPWGGWDRVAALLAVSRDTERTDEMLQRLMLESGAEQNAYAIYTRSQVLARGTQFEKAMVLAQDAVARAPGEAQLQTWAGRLSINLRDEDGALHFYRAAWQTEPDNRQLALVYAELLRQTGHPEDALVVLGELPDTPENRFAMIAFATESGQRDIAMDLYEGFATIQYEETLEAAFQAARSAEVLDLKEQAIGWYAQLEDSENALLASIRQAFLLADLGRLEEARQKLMFARNNGSPAVQLETTLVEAQLLSDAGENDAAFAVLEKALGQFPGDSRLLYTRSLLAVQLGRLDLAEADLRAVLASEPANAAALNALGYTLADQTDRYAEAEQLIRAAFELDPESPAIIDSMGWVAYRQGRLDEAENFLRQAFLRDRNAEIAAHLGEVLFMLGKEREARYVFNQGRRIDPDDPVLLETMERLGLGLQ